MLVTSGRGPLVPSLLWHARNAQQNRSRSLLQPAFRNGVATALNKRQVLTAAAASAGEDGEEAPKAIQTNILYVWQLLNSNSYQFTIPPMQRNYCWTTDQAEQLLQDLEENLDTSDEVENLAVYDLSQILLHRLSSNDIRTDIYDGQQRMTTLFLILAAVRHMVTDQEVKDSYKEFLSQTGNATMNRVAGPRLLVWEKAAPCFKVIIDSPTEVTKAIWKEKLGGEPKEPEDAARLIEIYNFVLQYLAEFRDEAKVKQLGQYILNRCFFNVQTTSDRSQAIQVLLRADRGMDMQASDVIKAELVASLPDDEGRALAEQWQAWEKERDGLGREWLQAFLLQLTQRDVSARSVPSAAEGAGGKSKGKSKSLTERSYPRELLAFLKRVRKQPGGIAEFTRVEFPQAMQAYRYAVCLDSYRDSPGSATTMTPMERDVNSTLVALNLLPKERTDWIPLAMDALMLHGGVGSSGSGESSSAGGGGGLSGNSGMLRVILRDLERLAWYHAVCGGSAAKQREARYAKAMAELRGADKGAALGSVLPSLQLEALESEELAEALRAPDLYNRKAGKSGLALPLLKRLDMAMRQTKPIDLTFYVKGDHSVEHVLPQTPRGEWLDKFPDEKERQQSTHSLGNLVILFKKLQAKASNYDFEKKVKVYFRSGSEDGALQIPESPLLVSVWRHPTWNASIVRSRVEELASTLLGPSGWGVTPR